MGKKLKRYLDDLTKGRIEVFVHVSSQSHSTVTAETSKKVKTLRPLKMQFKMLKKILHAHIIESFTEGQWVSAAACCLIRSSLIAIGFLAYVQPCFHWSHSASVDKST